MEKMAYKECDPPLRGCRAGNCDKGIAPWRYLRATRNQNVIQLEGRYQNSELPGLGGPAL